LSCNSAARRPDRSRRAVPAQDAQRPPPRAEQRADDAPRGRLDPRFDVEAVAVRLGVEAQAHPVAAALHRPVEAHQRAPLADVGLSRQARDPCLPGNRLADAELGDIKPADVDVEAGQHRPRLLGGAELGQAMKAGELRLEIVDDQPVGDPAQWLPVHLDQRRFREQPVGVVEADIDQPGVAPDRPVDPPDLDSEARFRRHRSDPVGKEAVAGAGVEQESGGDGEQKGGKEQAHRPLRKARGPAGAAAAARRRSGGLGLHTLRLFRRRFVHQKAWPSET
jgi:hypothetical protein